jgi:aspartate kinase
LGIVVQKYGGSSVADVERVGLVADRIAATKATGKDLVVVVSAMGDTTDNLLALAHKVTGNPPRRELDMLLSAGERISMAVLSMALHARNVPAVSFTGSQSGIITNDSHANARIVEVRPYRVQDELARGKVVIVAGYQGVSYKKEVTTLGRGGSDTTAVALAAALDAEACEIYSDVAGVYSADPRVVPDAHRLAEISYDEMQELARSGARVLNAQAVEFAKDRGIALYARKTFGDTGETVIRRLPPRAPGTVAGVSGETDLVLLGAASRDSFDHLLGFLADRDLVAKEASLSAADGEPSNASVLLSLENVHDFPSVRTSLAQALDGRITVVEGLGAVTAVGSGLGARIDTLRTAVEALKAGGLQVRGVLASDSRIRLLVAADAVPQGMRLLHAALVTP